MDRRRFIQKAAGAAAGAAAMSLVVSESATAGEPRRGDEHLRLPNEAMPAKNVVDPVLLQKYPFTLPALGYANNAVEPAVDALTMSIHRDKHHAAYVTNLNKALETQAELHQYTLGELLMGLQRWPAAVRAPLRNNGGGHANHAMFWGLLAPRAATASAPNGRLAASITREFGSPEACAAALKTAGLGQFGSGWTWLVKTATNRVAVRALPNQDTPLFDGELPIVGVDVWEHAYYLKYQDRRAAYLDAVLARINWDAASAIFNG